MVQAPTLKEQDAVDPEALRAATEQLVADGVDVLAHHRHRRQRVAGGGDRMGAGRHAAAHRSAAPTSWPAAQVARARSAATG